MLHSVKNGSVQLGGGIFNDRRRLNRAYLMELDSNCLLQNFYLEAGIILPAGQVINDPEKANMHWGWEAPSCQLRGHFLGHWMSAAARLTAETGDRELEAKLFHIVDELERCQKLNGGKWVGSIPEKYFDILCTDRYIWSPQYTLHKTIMGLTDTYRLTGYEPAARILRNLADWYDSWTTRMVSEGHAEAILAGEAGGMLEAWAEAFDATRDPIYRELAERYSGYSILKDLADGRDPLSNVHANASIPQAQGAAKMYEITGEAKWLALAEKFFKNCVDDRGMYCTGGQNAGEYWIPPKMLGTFAGDRNQEFCTVYNMVRLADYLYRASGKSSYADYIERNLYNGFLAQQNKHTGMPTYFLPMKAGGKKLWGSRTHDFWCCTGTMVQAQNLYPSLCYYEDGDGAVTIAQYIPSDYRGDGICIHQQCAMKYNYDFALFDENDDSARSRWFLEFDIRSEEVRTVRFRIPSWVIGTPVVTKNGTPVDPVLKDGYMILTEQFTGDRITMYLPCGLYTEPLPDCPDRFAVLEGPIVLAAVVGDDGCVRLPKDNPLAALEPHWEHSYEAFPWLQTNYRIRGTAVECKPLYDIVDERYTIYFTEEQA